MIRILSTLAVIIGCWLVSTISRADDRVDFNFDIRPILSDRCYICHGPDEENREADLRLDLKEGAFTESASGNVEHVVQPGDHEASELYLRVASDDPDVVMPPPDANLSLTPEEVELIRRWIDQGAEWKSHWSFLPIPSNPDNTQPTHEVIDELVAKPLHAAGFRLADPAGKRILLRRVSFDITGLPPTVDEIDAFLNDDSPMAYERVVDRLLASDRFGERMASVWLDAARYSDTYGYQVDRDRFVWPFRDWVVRQFNDNLPFDQFITQQLAGDLLPNPTDDQLLATTFNRLHPQKVEGGSVPEEFRIEYVADRAQTVATSIMGLTFECARCHDHKYDPISQKEYYQLTSFFDKIDEAGLYSYFTSSVPTPTLLMGDATFKQQQAELQAKVAAAETALTETIATLRSDLQDRESPAAIDGSPPKPIESLSFDDWKPSGKNQTVDGVRGQAVKLSGDDAVNLKQGNFTRYQPFSVSLWANVPAHRERAVIFHRSRAWTDAGSRGYECLIKDGYLTASLIHFWPGNAISVSTTKQLATQEWHHIAMTYDGSSRASGLRLYLNGKQASTSIVRDNLYKEITGGGNDFVSIGERFRDNGFKDGLVDEFQVFDRELTSFEVRLLATLDTTLEPTPDEQLQLAMIADEGCQKKLAELQAARQALCDLQKDVQEIMIMRETDKPRDTYILKRGDYTARAEKVSPGTLSALPPMQADLPRNRLGLAKWLVDPGHPLTARVAANRLWQIVFGVGLVRTPEDFGSQGQLPTHPELLDRLARDFIDHGWDTKAFMKQLVLSRTYRQSSNASRELLAADPENRLYGRAPSYRLPAEMLRDQALLASDLLVEKIGGPPVKPYDLKYSFKPMDADKGEGLYRRSLYTYWKRTGPSPAMMALDAAKRDVCRVQRSSTSSPLQTLVLMNSPQIVEASRCLAEQVLQEHKQLDQQVTQIFLRLTGRNPTSGEMEVLSELYSQQYELFKDCPEDAEAYLNVGAMAVSSNFDPVELAATTGVINALFGLDEVMMKR